MKKQGSSGSYEMPELQLHGQSRGRVFLNMWEIKALGKLLLDQRPLKFPQNKKKKTLTFSSFFPLSLSLSVFLAFLFNLSADMFHGASKVAVKAAGRNRS